MTVIGNWASFIRARQASSYEKLQLILEIHFLVASNHLKLKSNV